jgi:autotransporter-associated beta strand protein
VNSGQLTLGGNETVSSLAGTGGTIALVGNSLTVAGNTYSNLFQGVISGSGSLIKDGTGYLRLSGNNTYGGGTFLNGGTLDSDSTNAFGTGFIIVGSGTTLNLESHNVANSITNNGGTILSSGTVSDVDAEAGQTTIGGDGSTVTQAAGTATVTVTGNEVTVNNVEGSAQVNIGGTGASVGTVSGGTVTLSNGATGATVTTASGGTVNANASGTTLGTVSGSAAVNVGGANGRVGTLSGGSVAANADGLVVTNFNGGNIAVASRVTVGLQSGSSAGVISGQGGIAKQGASTLTLSGVNTYSGATTVEAGKLIVNGSVASSAVTVQSGAILGGGGTIGSLTLNGILAPGNSAGTTTSVGNTFWNQGSSYDWEIFNLAGPAGTGWDLLSVTGGTLDLTGITGPGGFTINLITLQGNNNTQGALTGFDPATNYATGWMIASASSISGFNASEFNINKNLFVSGSGTFAIEQRAISGGQGLFVTYTGGGSEPIPEPGTWAAAALLAGAAGYVRWRRRKEQAKDA